MVGARLIDPVKVGYMEVDCRKVGCMAVDCRAVDCRGIVDYMEALGMHIGARGAGGYPIRCGCAHRVRIDARSRGSSIEGLELGSDL
jgi:hypothetical protein